MATHELNTNRCDIAHEAHTPNEYGESGAATVGRSSKGRGMQRNGASRSAPEEALDSVIFFISSALPKCP
jgi:hypothetical protein